MNVAEVTLGEIVERLDALERILARLSVADTTAATPDVLTRAEAARYARLSVRTLDEHVRSGAVRVAKRGNRVLIRRVDLDAFLAPAVRAC